MDTLRRPHRVSLFAKFTAVIMLLGIVPIVLLVTVLQSRMLTEYRASLEDAYQDAIAYSAYSIRARLDTYTDLSKFCYYYNYSSQGDFSYDYDNYDNLRKILSGEVFADADNVADSIRREMGLFLHYLNMTDADIEASHFIYAPAGAAKVVSYQLGNYNNSLFDSEAYLRAVDFEHWDTESRKMVLVPTHALDYIGFRGSRTPYVFTVGRNYYDITGAVGHEKYLGTLFLDLRTDVFDKLFATLNLTDGGTVYAAGRINSEQVPVYAEVPWAHDAAPEQVLVLHTLVVDPAAAGHGYGTQFVRFYEQYAREHGCPELRIDTNAKNANARRLYAYLGYREAGVAPCTFNGIDGVALVCLEKWLGAEP